MTEQYVFDENEVKMILSLKERAATIFNRSEFDAYKDSTVLAGGCFTSWFHGEKPKDLDVFIFGDIGRLIHIKKRVEMATPNVLDDVTGAYHRNNDKIHGVVNDNTNGIQYIYTSYKSREELVRDFDFVHTMVSYHMGKIYITRQTYDAIRQKHLIYNNEQKSASWRLDKFTAKGWKVVPAIDGELSENEYRGIMRQPVVGASQNWQSAVRINPVRNVPWSHYSTNLAADTIKAKLLQDLEENGQ